LAATSLPSKTFEIAVVIKKASAKEEFHMGMLRLTSRIIGPPNAYGCTSTILARAFACRMIRAARL
jgi:hypothetical protein